MPIYEYEPLDHDCTICPNRIEVLEEIGAEPLSFCPSCGLGVKRIVSQASIRIGSTSSASRAAKAGFTTWKKAGENTWDKVDGPGVDTIVGDPRDVAQVKQDSKPSKVLNLDNID